jgi:hypothetical protein
MIHLVTEPRTHIGLEEAGWVRVATIVKAAQGLG